MEKSEPLFAAAVQHYEDAIKLLPEDERNKPIKQQAAGVGGPTNTEKQGLSQCMHMALRPLALQHAYLGPLHYSMRILCTLKYLVHIELSKISNDYCDLMKHPNFPRFPLFDGHGHPTLSKQERKWNTMFLVPPRIHSIKLCAHGDKMS